jgi:hypothetical protein
LAFISAAAQDLNTQPEMHTRVISLYSFSPHAISDADRQKKSDEMDAFWNDVKTNQSKELPLLRAELKAPGEPASFIRTEAASCCHFQRTRQTAKSQPMPWRKPI